MSNRIYVANISFSATNEDLRGHFANFGQVIDAKIMNDRDTGRSRGFGFITMATSEDAARAIDSLNNTDFLGRRLFVNVARDRDANGSSGAPNRNAPSGGFNRNAHAGGGFNRSHENAGGRSFDSRRNDGYMPDVSYKRRPQTGGFDTPVEFGPPSGDRRFDRGTRRSRNRPDRDFDLE